MRGHAAAPSMAPSCATMEAHAEALETPAARIAACMMRRGIVKADERCGEGMERVPGDRSIDSMGLVLRPRDALWCSSGLRRGRGARARASVSAREKRREDRNGRTRRTRSFRARRHARVTSAASSSARICRRNTPFRPNRRRHRPSSRLLPRGTRGFARRRTLGKRLEAVSAGCVTRRDGERTRVSRAFRVPRRGGGIDKTFAVVSSKKVLLSHKNTFEEILESRTQSDFR